MRYAWIVAVLALLAALLVSGYTSISVPASLDGTVYDRGASGFTRLIEILEARGYHVQLGLVDPRLLNEKPTLLILDPRFCEAKLVYELLGWLRAARPKAVLILGDSECVAYIASLLLKARPEGLAEEAHVSLLNETVVMHTALYWPALGEVLATDGIRNFGFKLGSTVVIGDADWLRNNVVERNAGAFLALLSEVNASRTIVVPTWLETGRVDIALPLAALALILVQYLVHLEKLVSGSPWFALLLVAAVAYTAYKLIARAGRAGDVVYERPRPPTVYSATALYTRMLRGARLASLEAKTVIVNLYELLDSLTRSRLGFSIEDAIGDERLLARLASLAGVEKARLERLLRRLRVLYERATGRRKLWPPVLWGRAAKSVVREAGDLLKGVGVELETLRGVEVQTLA